MTKNYLNIVYEHSLCVYDLILLVLTKLEMFTRDKELPEHSL